MKEIGEAKVRVRDRVERRRVVMGLTIMVDRWPGGVRYERRVLV